MRRLKKEKLSDRVQRVGEDDAAVGAAPEAVTPAPVAPRARQQARRFSSEKVAATIYMDPALETLISDVAHARRGEVSAYSGQKFKRHDIFLEAIDEWMEKRGYGSIIGLREAIKPSEEEEA